MGPRILVIGLGGRPQADAGVPRFLRGEGELVRLIRDYDWSRTDLGHIDQWPQSLRTTVAMIVHSQIPIVLLWGVKGYMIYNDAYSKFAGGRHPALLGSEVRQGWPEVAEFNDRVMKVGLNGGTLAYRDQELTLYRRDVPEQVWMNLDYSPVFDESGSPAGVIAIVVETTERKQADAALERLNETLEQRIEERTALLMAKDALIATFFNHSAECHAVLSEMSDGRFKFEEANPAVLDLYGKTRSEVVGHTVEELFAPDRAAELTAHLRACLRNGAPYRYEREHDGAVVEAVATPVPPESGSMRRLVVSARDVSEHRNLEQQLRQAQKMEAVGQLTGGLAHDFNNLLTGITGSLELLEKRFDQRRFGDVDRYLHAAKGAAKRAAALTHRLLAFSRRQTLDPKPVDINLLVSGIVDLIQRTMGPGITFEFVGAIDLWNTVADPHQLENALLNLCINARDAMPDGGRLTVETGNRWIDGRSAADRDLAPGQYVSLSVSDTGSGMSAETASRAFDPFFTTKPLGEGTGLGLSMVYGFARQSGGQARIYSEEGRGTTVSVYLPRHADQTALAVEPGEVTTVTAAKQGETVLVVDDERTVRMLIMDVLEELGYAAIDAEDGKAGLAVLESKRHIDLLITDVGLPGGMNGRQLADAGLLIRPELKVLFITGYAENAVIGDGRLQHGMHVLTKPFAMDSLAQRIAGILNSSR